MNASTPGSERAQSPAGDDGRDVVVLDHPTGFCRADLHDLCLGGMARSQNPDADWLACPCSCHGDVHSEGDAG